MKPGNNTALSYFSCFEQCKGRIDLILFNLLGKIYLKIRGSIVIRKNVTTVRREEHAGFLILRNFEKFPRTKRF
jgi:hypothetical protein